MCADVAGFVQTKKVSEIDFVDHKGIAGNLSRCVRDYGSVNLNHNEEEKAFCTHCQCLGGSKVQRRDKVFLSLSLYDLRKGMSALKMEKIILRRGRGHRTRCDNPRDKPEIQ